jgi:hypothetical protein
VANSGGALAARPTAFRLSLSPTPSLHRSMRRASSLPTPTGTPCLLPSPLRSSGLHLTGSSPMLRALDVDGRQGAGHGGGEERLAATSPAPHRATPLPISEDPSPPWRRYKVRDGGARAGQLEARRGVVLPPSVPLAVRSPCWLVLFSLRPSLLHSTATQSTPEPSAAWTDRPGDGTVCLHLYL